MILERRIQTRVVEKVSTRQLVKIVKSRECGIFLLDEKAHVLETRLAHLKAMEIVPANAKGDVALAEAEC